MPDAAVIDASRHLTIIDLPRAELGPANVTLEVAFCGLCGSDLHLMFGPAEPMAGHVLGHEFSAVVSEVGPGVCDWGVGDRVVVCPVDSCGDCGGCRAADGICISGLMRGPGLGAVGGLASSVTVPSRLLHRIPGALGLREAALTEPLAVAVRGVRRARLPDDPAVVVMGAGPIGMLTLAVLRSRGVRRILVAEPNDTRRRTAEQAGAIVATPADLPGATAANFPDGVTAIFECSGHPGTVAQAANIAGYGARIVLLGVPETASEVHMMTVAINELSVIGSTAYTADDFAEALSLLASGRVDTGRLITSTVGLHEADRKIHELASGRSVDVKVLVQHRQRATS